MIHWFASHILSTGDIVAEEFLPMDNAEFIVSMSMVVVALALFGIIIHLSGA